MALVRLTWQHTYEVKVLYSYPRIVNAIPTVSRRQGQFREELSGGSPSAKPGAHAQECDRRPSPGGESANDDDAPWVWDRVNHRVVRGKFVVLFGEICL